MGALPPSTIGGSNVAATAHLKGGPAVKPSGRRNQQKRPQALQTPASPATRSPTLWSVMNMPSGAALARADGGAVTTSLDLGEDDDDELFHKFNQHRMQQCGAGGEPSEPPQRVQPHSLKWEDLSPERQTISWLQ